MNRQEALISRALTSAKLSSYGALAKRLGVSAATMSQWRSGTSKLSEERVTQLSEIAGDDPGIWLLSMMAEECNIGTLRKSLQQIVNKVSKGMPMAIALAITAPLAIGSGDKSQENQAVKSEKTPVMYIMFGLSVHVARFMRRVGSILRWQSTVERPYATWST